MYMLYMYMLHNTDLLRYKSSNKGCGNAYGYKTVAAFRGMHAPPAKHSYA